MGIVRISHPTSRLSPSAIWEFAKIKISSEVGPRESHKPAAPPTPSPPAGSLSPAIIRQRFADRKDAESIVEPDGPNYLRVWIGLEDGTTDTSQPVNHDVVFISVDLENVRVISWFSKPDMA
ncbi:hypothetical protein N3K66_004813 [Trichothecium roseum]|uniref:Uncharacterized protein n=1 Tax=Trichothecium roseum TaxID=47278 RepID=A0ACC0V331_9HYPO|nr:hypothetical protein N3K66_004813 [Trichothecium roseum]